MPVMPPPLTDAEYPLLRARIDKQEAWVNTIRKKTKCRRCKGQGHTFHGQGQHWSTADRCPKCDGTGFILGWASYKPEDVPADIPQVTNEDRSRVEVYEFKRDKPHKYFAYVYRDGMTNQLESVRTFTGDLIGRITWHGPVYEVRGFGPFPSQRQNLRINAVNGLTYSAVYFLSSGDYCQMKAFTNTKANTTANTNEVTK